MRRSEGEGESEGDSGGGLCESVHKNAQPQNPHIFILCCRLFGPPHSVSDTTEEKAYIYIMLIMHLISALSHFTGSNISFVFGKSNNCYALLSFYTSRQWEQ